MVANQNREIYRSTNEKRRLNKCIMRSILAFIIEMFHPKKKRGKTRQRKKHVDESEDEAEESIDISSVLLQKKVRGFRSSSSGPKQKSTPSSKSEITPSTTDNLSFIQEDRLSTSSKFEIVKGQTDTPIMATHSIMMKKDEAAGGQSKGEYSAEKLAELKRAQKYTRSKVVQAVDVEIEEEEEEFISLSSENMDIKKRRRERSGKKTVQFAAFGLDEGEPAAAYLKREEHGRENEPVEEEEDAMALEPWELEQLRRGGHGSFFDQNQNSIRQDILETEKTLPQLETIELKMEQAVGISETSGHPTSDDSRSPNTHERLKVEMDTVTAEVKKIEREFQSASDQYEYFQHLRDQVSNLCGCMREKIPMIEQLIETHTKLQHRSFRQHHQDLRRQDVLDQMDQIGQYHYSVTMPAQFLAFQQEQDQADQEDFAGRNISKSESKAKTLDIRNQARTSRRMKRRQTYHWTTLEEEGLDSDNNGEEIFQSERRRQKLQEAALVIFEDAEDNVVDIEALVRVFRDWKRNDRESYVEAFVSRSLSKILLPLVQFQLAYVDFWDPLESPWTGLEGFHFVSSLSDLNHEDEEDMIIPDLIEAVVVPMITQAIESKFNPLSRTQNQILMTALVDLSTIFNTSETMQSKLSCIMTKIRDQYQHLLTDHHLYLPHLVSSTSVHQETVSYRYIEAQEFVEVQFWKIIRLAQNIGCWTLLPEMIQLMVPFLMTVVTQFLGPFLQHQRTIIVNNPAQDSMALLKMYHAILHALYAVMPIVESSLSIQMPLVDQYCHAVLNLSAYIPEALKAEIQQIVCPILVALAPECPHLSALRREIRNRASTADDSHFL